MNSQMPLSYADPGANLVLKKVSEEGLDLVLESEKSRATATVVYKVIYHWHFQRRAAHLSHDFFMLSCTHYLPTLSKS